MTSSRGFAANVAKFGAWLLSGAVAFVTGMVPGSIGGVGRQIVDKIGKTDIGLWLQNNGAFDPIYDALARLPNLLPEGLDFADSPARRCR